MPQASLNLKKFDFSNARDSIVIVKALGDLPGGRTLDVAGYNEDVIFGGHVIAKKKANEGNGDVYFPLAITGKAYDGSATFAEPQEGETVVGILKASITKEIPIGAIVTLGQIKEAAMPAKMPEKVKSALPHIQFI